MKESEIQRHIIKALEIQGCLVFRMNSGKIQNNVRLAPAGTPDLLTITPAGRVYWIEVKTPDGTVSKAQKKMHKELKDRGQKVIIARKVDDAIWN